MKKKSVRRMMTIPKYRTKEHSSSIGSLWHHIENNDFDMDMDYQRDYVWREKEQQDFLKSLFHYAPVGTISLAIKDAGLPDRYIEVIDGKQRLTTLKLFMESKISYNGFYYRDLDNPEKLRIKGLKMPSIMLEPYGEASELTRKVKIEYFHNINFSGVPQSEEHRLNILALLEKENE